MSSAFSEEPMVSETVTTKHGEVRFTESVTGNVPGHHVANLNGKWLGSVVFPQSGGGYVWVSSVLSRKGRAATLKDAAVKLAEAAVAREGDK